MASSGVIIRGFTQARGERSCLIFNIDNWLPSNAFGHACILNAFLCTQCARCNALYFVFISDQYARNVRVGSHYSQVNEKRNVFLKFRSSI